MDIQVFVERLLEDRSTLDTLPAPLSDTDAVVVVERLKQEADRHWYINAHRSLSLAELIVRIGEARGDLGQTALGMMARGDALKFLSHMEEAWETLGRAGDLFTRAGDEVGWARTRIGRLAICVDLNHVAEALADAERARAIFTAHGDHERALRLTLNTGVVYHLLGDHRRALPLYHAALTAAEQLGQAGEEYLGLLSMDLGLTYEALGDFRKALAAHMRAREFFASRDEIRGVGNAECNIAAIVMAQGDYRHALQLLHRVYDLKVTQQLPMDAAYVKRNIVECYLALNRYDEARDLAGQAAAEFGAFGAAYEQARALLALAVAEAQLGQFPAARSALDRAEHLFETLGADAWLATTRLRRGRVALQQGDTIAARQAAALAAAAFESSGQQVNYAAATLLLGQARSASGERADAAEPSAVALRIARRCNVPWLRYTAHLLLGRIAEAAGNPGRAARRYTAAAATVERMQRGLTITLRPGFLEDKGEALRALITLHLRAGRAGRAFENLERAKSQVLLGHLANRQHLRWATGDSRDRELIEELNQLREEHQWFYRLAHDQAQRERVEAHALDPQQALIEVALRERRMRTITERLYLSGENRATGQLCAPSLRDIQSSLPEGALLIEFYNDGARLWAFTLAQDTLEAYPLPIGVEALDQLMAQFQNNLTFALNSGPDAPAASGLTNQAQRILQRLYSALLEPLASRLRGRGRLTIVPYGALHYLPFHLLHNGSEYLIERYEVVILPAAGLATRRAPRREGGALVLAHSWEGRLPHTHAEARLVQRMFGGQAYYDQAARRETLCAQPTRILHIAAHGEHRLDQPDLSYIQLADSQLYTDDLLQQDMSYELVTLSACETGRATVAAGDELIGLGRGFLYAGAGALIVSLWRVSDDSTLALMERMYQNLWSGASKAGALRAAQRAIVAEYPRLHPAFWGAFQLVGDAHPLSTSPLRNKGEFEGAAPQE